MSTNLIVIRTHKIGLTNIIPALILAALGDRGFQTCAGHLIDSRYLGNKLGEFASNFPVKDPETQLRSVQWENNTTALNYLDQCLNLANKQNKIVFFGSHFPEQIAYLQSKYPQITIGGSHYNKEHYPLMIKAMATDHIYMLQNNILPANTQDLILLDSYTQQELLEHYSCEFDNMQLVPEFTTPYINSLDIANINNKNSVVEYINSLGLQFTNEVDDLYTRWRQYYFDPLFLSIESKIVTT